MYPSCLSLLYDTLNPELAEIGKLAIKANSSLESLPAPILTLKFSSSRLGLL